MKKGLLLTILGLFSLTLFAQPIVNGDLSDADYISLATKQNANASFGANIDVTEMVYYPDNTNSRLYFGIKGKLDVGSNNGIGFFLNFSNLTGVAAGTPLGFSGAGHYMDGQGGGMNDDFNADFEVDYMFAMNPGSGSTSVFLDAANIVGGNSTDFIGTSDQSGGTATDSDVFGTGAAATFAFNNGGGANQGFEIVFDYAALGITSASTLEAFTFVVSETGFFSDVTVPGNVTTGQPGFNASFNTLSGGPYNSGDVVLPVELKNFQVKADGKATYLSWTTASELNNSHFEIECSPNAKAWKPIGKVQGNGTTLEQQNYTFVDENPFDGISYYRLKQVDEDGKYEYSSVLSVLFDANSDQDVIEVYPTLVQDQLTVTNGVGEAIIYNQLAQIVKKVQLTDFVAQVDVSDLASGQYVLFITTTTGKKKIERFIK